MTWEKNINAPFCFTTSGNLMLRLPICFDDASTGRSVLGCRRSFLFSLSLIDFALGSLLAVVDEDIGFLFAGAEL